MGKHQQTRSLVVCLRRHLSSAETIRYLDSERNVNVLANCRGNFSFSLLVSKGKKTSIFEPECIFLSSQTLLLSLQLTSGDRALTFPSSSSVAVCFTACGAIPTTLNEARAAEFTAIYGMWFGRGSQGTS